MNSAIFKMTATDMGLALGTGAICALIFMYLLWETVKLLPRVKHKYLFLFLSKALRIFLLLCVMILFSDNHAGKFILISCGFLIVRLFILHFVSFRVYHQTEEKQLTKAFRKKRGK